MAGILLRSVNKVFPNGAVAASDFTLDIADGELLVLVGPSGSGKSTVLRLIAGLDTPTSGQILIGDRDVTEVPPQARDLAMVFQNYALYPHKTVRENMAFSLQIRGFDRTEIAGRVDKAAGILDIAMLLDRKPAQLSGGQRQRVALGRAIVREPQAFLLDEPLSNLDPVLRVSTRAELSLLHRRLGTTMVYVTHDQEEAMTLGTRIAVMREGQLQQVDSPLNVFNGPANVFVASFVGAPAMNLWPCTVVPVEGAVGLRTSAFVLDTGDTPGRLDEAAIVGIRPHDIEVTPPGDGDARGRVEVVETLGASTLLHLGGDAEGRSLVRVVVPSDHPVRVGEQVGYRLRRDRIHLFSKAGSSL